MKKLPALAALCFSLLTAGWLSAERVEQVLTLPQSTDRALLNNQKLLAAFEDIRIAEHRVKEAQSLFYPKVGLNLNGSRYLAERDYVLPADFGNTLLPVTEQAEADTYYSARAWMRQPLYSGGRVRNTIRLAQKNLERARILHEEIRQQVIFDNVKAFNDVLLRRKEIDLYEKAVKEGSALRDEKPARDPRRRMEMETIVSRLRRGLARARRAHDRAHLAFLDALGVELYTKVAVDGRLESAPRPSTLR